MLHGIIAVCPRTGSLLFSKAYAPSFGLPLPAGGQPMDAHNLASLVFALQINATAVLDGSSRAPGHEGSSNGVGEHEPVLRSVDMGPGLRLVFYKDVKLPGLLLTLSLDPALGDRAEKLLAESICNSFAVAYGEQLRQRPQSGGAALPVRRLKSAGKLVRQCLLAVSRLLLHDLMQTFDISL